VNTAIFLYFVP